MSQKGSQLNKFKLVSKEKKKGGLLSKVKELTSLNKVCDRI